MNAIQIFRNRAILAWWLQNEAGLSQRDIALVLRATGPDEVRRWLERGKRLNSQLPIANSQ